MKFQKNTKNYKILEKYKKLQNFKIGNSKNYSKFEKKQKTLNLL